MKQTPEAYRLLASAGMQLVTRLAAVAFVLAAATVAPLRAGDSDKQAFIAAWQGRDVVLTRTLYSIAFDERSRWVPLVKHEGRIAGLVVATPSDTYYEFQARRDSEDDVIARDPNVVVSTLRTQYRRSTHLEIGNVQDVEPLMLVRYEPGVQLVVRKVQIERDRVRLILHKGAKGDLATTLTVKWPVPFSKELTESAIVEDVLSRFVARR